MGRESIAAFMPTSFISGGSCAPIENSPPDIQAIPCGAGPGAGVWFGIVDPNATADSTGFGVVRTSVVRRPEYTAQPIAPAKTANPIPANSLPLGLDAMAFEGLD